MRLIPKTTNNTIITASLWTASQSLAWSSSASALCRRRGSTRRARPTTARQAEGLARGDAVDARHPLRSFRLGAGRGPVTPGAGRQEQEDGAEEDLGPGDAVGRGAARGDIGGQIGDPAHEGKAEGPADQERRSVTLARPEKSIRITGLPEGGAIAADACTSGSLTLSRRSCWTSPTGRRGMTAGPASRAPSPRSRRRARGPAGASCGRSSRTRRGRRGWGSAGRSAGQAVAHRC